MRGRSQCCGFRANARNQVQIPVGASWTSTGQPGICRAFCLSTQALKVWTGFGPVIGNGAPVGEGGHALRIRRSGAAGSPGAASAAGLGRTPETRFKSCSRNQMKSLTMSQAFLLIAQNRASDSSFRASSGSQDRLVPESEPSKRIPRRRLQPSFCRIHRPLTGSFGCQWLRIAASRPGSLSRDEKARSSPRGEVLAGESENRGKPPPFVPGGAALGSLPFPVTTRVVAKELQRAMNRHGCPLHSVER